MKKTSSILKIAVLGSGSWGTAMALYLARIGHEVFLVPRDPQAAEKMRHDGKNADYIPQINFPKNLRVEESFNIIRDVSIAFLACPSQGIVEFSERIRAVDFPSGRDRPFLISLCKGLVSDGLDLPSTVLQGRLPDFSVGCLSGPTYAADVALGKPTAAVLAANLEEGELSRFQLAINSTQFRIYRSHDLIGVELGGCLKNPYAIGMGFAFASDCGDNGRAALLTRMAAELARIGVALGGRLQTFYGLSGLGDLLATGQGSWSRNRSFGERVAKGERPAQIVASQKAVVEGYRSTKSFYEICRRRHIPCPILDGINKVVYGNVSPDKILNLLMSRDLTVEA